MRSCCYFEDLTPCIRWNRLQPTAFWGTCKCKRWLWGSIIEDRHTCCICQSEMQAHSVCWLDAAFRHNEYRPLQENCSMVWIPNQPSGSESALPVMFWRPGVSTNLRLGAPSHQGHGSSIIGFGQCCPLGTNECPATGHNDCVCELWLAHQLELMSRASRPFMCGNALSMRLIMLQL